MRRPRHTQLAPQGHGHHRRRSSHDGRHLGHRMLVATPLLHEHLWLPHDPRTRRRHSHRLQGGQSGDDRMADLGRRRRPRHRRQPLHPRRAPQHRHQHAAAQQQDLRPHQGTVFAHERTRLRVEDLALRHDGGSVHPCGAGVWRTRQLLRTQHRRGAADLAGGAHRRRTPQRHKRGGDTSELCDIQQRHTQLHH